MRPSLSSLPALALGLGPVLAATSLLACSSGGSGSGTPAGSSSSSASGWSCASSEVPNGATVACTTAALTTAPAYYTCTTGTVDCPPPTVDAGPPPTGCNNNVDGTCGFYDGGATYDAEPPVLQGGGEAGADDSGTPCDDAGGGNGNGHGNGGGGGNGHGGGGGNGGGNGHGNGGGGGYDAGTTGGGDQCDAGTGYPQDDAGTPMWTCTNDGNYTTCNSPPSCAPGTHASACGACVTDGTCDDCVPPASGGCWVTGGGFINGAGTGDSFGGNAMPMKSGTIRGEWEDVDHASGNKTHGEAQYLYCRHVNEPGPGQPSGPSHNFDINQVYFGGPARWFTGGTWADGYWFDVMAEDHGEGKGAHAGGPDYYHFTVRQISGAGVSGAVIHDAEASLGGGNIQIHPPNNGHPYTASSLPPWVSLQP